MDPPSRYKLLSRDGVSLLKSGWTKLSTYTSAGSSPICWGALDIIESLPDRQTDEGSLVGRPKSKFKVLVNPLFLQQATFLIPEDGRCCSYGPVFVLPRKNTRTAANLLAKSAQDRRKAAGSCCAYAAVAEKIS